MAAQRPYHAHNNDAHSASLYSSCHGLDIGLVFLPLTSLNSRTLHPYQQVHIVRTSLQHAILLLKNLPRVPSVQDTIAPTRHGVLTLPSLPPAQTPLPLLPPQTPDSRAVGLPAPHKTTSQPCALAPAVSLPRKAQLASISDSYPSFRDPPKLFLWDAALTISPQRKRVVLRIAQSFRFLPFLQDQLCIPETLSHRTHFCLSYHLDFFFLIQISIITFVC